MTSNVPNPNSSISPRKLAETLLFKQNKRAKFYFYSFTVLLVLLLFLYVFLIASKLYLFKYDYLSSFFRFNLKIFFLTLIDLSGLIFIIISLNIPLIRNLFIRIISSNKSELSLNRDSSIHDTFFIGGKFLLSLIVVSCFIILPGLFNHLFILPEYLYSHPISIKSQVFPYPPPWLKSFSNISSLEAFEGLNKNFYIETKPVSILFSQFIGLIISISFISLMTIYLIFLLPDILLHKIDKQKSDDRNNKYIYWLYFFKSRFIESPVILIISLPLLNLLFGAISYLFFIPSTNMTDRIKFTCISLIITALVAIAADLLKSYTNLTKIYNDYSNHLIKNRLILINKFSVMVIGYGNYGSTVINTLYLDFINHLNQLVQKKSKKSPSKDFEIIIDRDFELRLLSRRHIIIDIDTTKLEETFSDSAFNFKFGFFNCTHFFMSPQIASVLDIDSKFALPGIAADGADLGLWKILNFHSKPIIIDTTSDYKINIKLKKYLESNTIKQIDQPKLITTVFNELIESQFLNTPSTETHPYSSYPINYSFYESIAIVQRLIQLISKLRIDNIQNINIFLSCHKMVTTEIINTLVANLNLFLSKDEVTEFIQNQIFIDNHTPSIQDPTSYNFFANYMNNITHIIEFDNFKNLTLTDKKESFYSILTSDTKYQKSYNIFIVYSNLPLHSIKLLIDVRNLIHSLQINKSYILTSISEDYEADVKEIIDSHMKSMDLLQDQYYPSLPSEFIMKKDLAICNQITSIISALVKHDTSINSQYFNLSNPIIQFEICLSNEPLNLIYLLAKLKGYTIKSIIKSTILPIPSFIFNFSYTNLGYNGYLDLYTFRANFRLTEYDFSKEFTKPVITGLYNNPANNHLSSLFTPDLHCLDCQSSCKFCTLAKVFSSVSTNNQPPSKNESTSSTNLSDAIPTKPLLTEKGIGYIKITAHENTDPSSLLRILLLLYHDYIILEESQSETTYNIAYEIGTLCNTTTRYLQKFYLSPSNKKNKTFDVNSINSITIKYNDPKSSLWISYKNLISNKFENLSNFTLKSSEDELRILSKSSY